MNCDKLKNQIHMVAIDYYIVSLFSWWYRLIICKSSTNPLMGYNKDGIDSSSNYSKMMLPGKWCPAVAFYMMLFSGRARAVILLFKCNVS